MPYSRLGSFCVLSCPKNLTDEQQEKVVLAENLVADFARKFEKGFIHVFDNNHGLIFEISVPQERHIDRFPFSIALTVQNDVAVGYICGDEISFREKQFWILDRIHINTRDMDGIIHDIEKRFKKIVIESIFFQKFLQNKHG